MCFSGKMDKILGQKGILSKFKKSKKAEISINNIVL